MKTLGLVALMMVAIIAGAESTSAKDRHAGYYYPEPTSFETYKARARTLQESSRRNRITFVTNLATDLLKRPYAPEFSIFAKGARAEKLIIVSTRGDAYDTLYRARGLLARLTSIARVSPLFKKHKVDDFFTFLDLCKLMGFRQLTISDGRHFAHQFKIE
ncbi:MAG: hypothetical protein ACJAU6_002631 [Alphaproteobacteria bacterium]|jgi:hypothetical protein